MQTQDPAQLAHNEYARTRIRVAVQRLGRRLKLSRADREDVEQDLWVNLLEQAQNFDPERGAINTFIDRVVRSAVAMKIRHQPLPARDQDVFAVARSGSPKQR